MTTELVHTVTLTVVDFSIFM